MTDPQNETTAEPTVDRIADQAGAGLRLRQGRARGPGARPARRRRRAGLHGRLGEADRRPRPAGHQGRGPHRLPRVPRRPGQDAAPEGARRHPRRPAAADPRGAARRARDRAVRPGGLQPLPVHRDGDVGRLPGRVRRADRHRRALDGARGGQEPPVGRDRHLARRGTPTCSPRSARAASPSSSASGWPPRRSCTPRRTTCTWRAGWATCSPTPPTAPASRPGWAPPGTARSVLRYGENPHQPAALYLNGFGTAAWPRRDSCTARRCPTTTTSTPTRPGGRRTTSTSRRSRSSSTPTRAASRSAPTSPRRTARPTSATRSPRSAA